MSTLLVFLQDVFPTDFGPDYDNALQVLMLDFVSRLEKLLPVPDVQQVLKRSSPPLELNKRLQFHLMSLNATEI